MAAMLERIEKPGMTTRDILLELRDEVAILRYGLSQLNRPVTDASPRHHARKTLLPFQVC